ncbi:hypothetical protein AB833_29700 [Chromatiales bacterium (ex Bugula neritina AB1)]|nr:hypothetical protein AB833_29700 [Chromatiales bacterium (ex Bugula neritina AB1)]
MAFALYVTGYLLSQNALAEKTYVYKEVDGTLWYTNVAPTAQDTGRFKLISITGRSTASAGCNGLSIEKMQHREMQFDSTIRRYAREYRVDSKLVKAVVKNESCFDRKAVSSAGAEGLMQLMPPTAKSLGVTDSFNAEQNLRGGIQYLSELMAMYDNNLRLALAAYNAGPGTVKKYDGIPPYPETQRYVEKVMKSYKLYLREYLDVG